VESNATYMDMDMGLPEPETLTLTLTLFDIDIDRLILILIANVQCNIGLLKSDSKLILENGLSLL
jgi:hypothetical protein